MADQEPVHPLWQQFREELDQVADAAALAALRERFLSRRKGLISLELKNLSRLLASERPRAGQQLNRLKNRVEEALETKTADFEQQAQAQRLAAERIDVTLPGSAPPRGRIHLVRRVWREMEEILVRMGFTSVSGPEIESEYYNFEALNIPADHPARDDQDTFYVEGDLLLRTHTSPAQIRTMESTRPPVRIIAPGRVYRRDAVDATHTPMFHQIEVLAVDEGITLADLKGTLEVFFRALFTADIQVRLRPSFFPFVEPGAEVDLSCPFCAGRGCRVCKNSGWIEILGAGMVHPRVFEMVGYDPEKYTGFAWGMGIDRIAMLKHQVSDMRILFENDVRFLRQL